MRNSNTINIDLSKTSQFILFLAITLFFIHLMLHNYNNFQQNILQSDFYTRHFDIAIRNAISSIIDKNTKENNATIESILSHENSMISSIPLSEISVQNTTKLLNVNKIGNLIIVSLEHGNTLVDVLKEANIEKAQLIADAVNKKYKLNNLKIGDVLQVELIQQKDDHIKITIVNKVEIYIKNVNNKYVVQVSSLHRTQSSIHKNTLKLSKNSLQKAPFSQNVKKDLFSIIQLLKQENFFPLQLEIVYEKNMQNDNLLSVNLFNGSKSIKIYKFIEKSGIIHYVKSDGVVLTKNSNKKVSSSGTFKLSYPIHNPVIGSKFGMRYHPIMHRVKMHKGIDFCAARGTPIYAPADGTIIEVSNGRGFGKHIRIRHNNVYTTLYGHLDSFSNKKIGMKVNRGDIIGYVGRTGLASGDHLHFELHEHGRPINPLSLISNYNAIINKPSVVHLNAKQMNLFKKYQAEVNKKEKLV